MAKTPVSRTAVTDLHRTLGRHLLKHADFAELSGSYRRGEKKLGDVDYLLGNAHMGNVLEHLKKLHEDQRNPITLKKVNRAGPKHLSVDLVHKGHPMQVDFYTVPNSSKGAGHLHLTGPAEFNHMLRSFAKGKGMLLNQYGLHDRTTGKKLAGRTERAIFNKLGMREIPPAERSPKFFDTKDQYMIKRRGLAKEMGALDLVLASVALRLQKQVTHPNPAATGATGTYIAVYPENEKFRDIMTSLLQGLQLDDKLHCTIMYSENDPLSAHKLALANPQERHAARASKLVWWPGSNGTGYLVLQLDSPDLVKLHRRWIRLADMKHSFDDYKPHITLVNPIKDTPKLEALMDSINDYLKSHPLKIILTGEEVTALDSTK